MSLDEVKSIDCLFANDEGLHQITTEVGAIDKQTMREVADACLTLVEPPSPRAIRAVREREHLSKPIFLPATSRSVNAWSRTGNEAPSAPVGQRFGF